MNKEIRSFRIASTDDSRKVGGYAIVWNSLSVDLGGFREIISPTAITDELIIRSDIIFNYNHDNNYMLGRSRNGEGTLSLRIDETGLYFECDLPNSPMGDNIRESIKRGDLSQCSFAFSLDPNDETAETWEHKDDGIYRTINRIAGLYDVSCVAFPAYEETSISERAKILLQDMKDIELREEEVKDPEELEPQDEQEEKSCDDKEEERMEENEDEKQEEEPVENPDEEEKSEETEDEKSEEEPEEEKKQRNIQENKSRFNTMEKRFSLLSAIRSIANGQQLSAAEQAVVNAGAAEMTRCGQPFSGQIQIPVEMRDDPVHYTVDADGEHVVVTDFLNILEPLKAKNVLVAAGANYLTGLQGNVQIPAMTAENVYWEGEIEETENGAGSFSHITMAPRRLSAYIDISKQFLVQDTLGAEALIRKLLVEAINDKLEATILSDDAASGSKPAGIFYGVSPVEISDYADVCDFEASLEENNFIGDFKYVINPKAKAALRSMIKGTNATGMVLENNAIDGTPAEVTTHMEDNLMAYGSWGDLFIGQWGAIDLTVDPYTKAASGQVRLVINAFFDYKVVREGAIVLGEYKAGE